MKKVDLAQSVNTLANIGVIVGIAFLALELNQNNRLLRAEAEYNYMEGRLIDRRQIIFDPEYAEFVTRVGAGEPLSPTDQLRVTTSVEASFLGRQWEFGQFLDGNFSVTEDELASRWRREFEAQPENERDLQLTVWSEFRATLGEDYVEFMEENVFHD